MFKKVWKRLFDVKGHHSISQNAKWMKENCSDFEQFANSLDADLWNEAKRVSKTLKEHADRILETVEYDLGGGGIYPLLYFIARYTNPDCIVETGVAAGFSSYAFLLAISNNKKGKLYSSDFPYFRLPHPEQYIGIVVENSLKDNWELYIDGDEANLPRILAKVDKIDIFHYDSDKSYSGRRNAISMIEGHMSEDGIILMDDIQDNSYFYDRIEQINPSFWHIFEFQGKFIGMIGKLTNRCA